MLIVQTIARAIPRASARGRGRDRALEAAARRRPNPPPRSRRLGAGVLNRAVLERVRRSFLAGFVGRLCSVSRRSHARFVSRFRPPRPAGRARFASVAETGRRAQALLVHRCEGVLIVVFVVDDASETV